MSARKELIVFVDNSVHRIYKSIDGLKASFENIQVFSSEKEALEYITAELTDLIFLNLDLTPQDAVSVTKELKQKKLQSNPFIVVYSDKQDDFVQEMVFNSGADSFINFHNKPDILKLFIHNLLRRKQAIAGEKKKQIIINEDQYLVFKNGVPLQLPRKEFRVFELLYTNAGKFFSKTEIAKEIWRDEEVAKKRIIDVHIYNIRQLFGKRVIQSQKGKGYRVNNKYI